MNDFTIDELNVLIDAMEAWERGDSSGEMLGDLVGAMLMSKAGDDEKAEYDRKDAERKQKSEDARRQRKERSILIRAKLVQLLDARRAAELMR